MLNLYKSWTDDKSANEEIGKQMINESIRTIASINSGAWYWLENLVTLKTLSGVQNYKIPSSLRKPSDIYIQVGTGTTAAIWYPELVYSDVIWKKVLSARLGSGDVPRYIYVQNRDMFISPIPQT